MMSEDSVIVATPMGYVELVANQQGLVKVSFEQLLTPSSSTSLETQPQTSNPTLLEVANQLAAYFAGKQPAFSQNLLVSAQGTDFQRSVWQVIAEIPYGQVMSYKEIAETIGKPRAYRAVANACGKNPLPIIVPCHRVVGSGSKGRYTLGGYSSGLDKKKFLMELEKITL